MLWFKLILTIIILEYILCHSDNDVITVEGFHSNEQILLWHIYDKYYTTVPDPLIPSG